MRPMAGERRSSLPALRAWQAIIRRPTGHLSLREIADATMQASAPPAKGMYARVYYYHIQGHPREGDLISVEFRK